MQDASFSSCREDLQSSLVRDEFIAISLEYFRWMDGEIAQHCGFTIPDIVGMPLEDYVLHTVDIASDVPPRDGGLYFCRAPDGGVAAMGGLRRLPDGAAEIVRIFTRPAFRGRGLGAGMVEFLIGEAVALGYSELCLDTGVFMRSAQKIYGAAGFAPCEAYAGAEPPTVLRPSWLFMKRSLGGSAVAQGRAE